MQLSHPELVESLGPQLLVRVTLLSLMQIKCSSKNPPECDPMNITISHNPCNHCLSDNTVETVVLRIVVYVIVIQLQLVRCPFV